MCWPFKGKHPLKIFVVENIDSLQVSIHSYTNLCFENLSITLSNLIHFLQRPDLKQYLSQYKSFKNHQPLLSLHHHGKESEAPHLPSPLLHRLFLQPSTPGPLPSMMWPLFPLPLSGGRPPSVTSSRPMGRLIHNILLLQISSPSPPAPHHSSPRSISVTSIATDKGKVSILCSLHDITSKTHLAMFNGMASAVPRLICPPRTAGDSPLFLSPIDIDRKELQRGGEGEYSVWFAL